MVQRIAISEQTTLKYLREKFGLERTEEADFFPEWQGDRSPLSDTEQQTLTKIRDRYFHQLDEGMMLENGVNLKQIGQLSF